MESVKVSLSPAQRSKIRKGHAVRIKKSMEGSGFNLIVKPHRINPITRAFDRDRAYTIKLDDEELKANKEESNVEGQGIFGRQAARGGKKAAQAILGKEAGRKATKAVNVAATRVGLPVAKAGLDLAAATAAPALMSVGVPAPIAIAAPMAASNIAKGYLSDPKAYQKKGGEKQALKDLDLGKVAAKTASGTFKEQQKQKKAQAKGGRVRAMKPAVMPPDLDGEGLFAGKGLYASRGVRGMGVMGRGALLNTHHDLSALDSQPLSANFHMANQLPPFIANIIRS
jgi:hypothetical protein